jgi:hypothetical protein
MNHPKPLHFLQIAMSHANIVRLSQSTVLTVALAEAFSISSKKTVELGSAATLCASNSNIIKFARKTCYIKKELVGF